MDEPAFLSRARGEAGQAEREQAFAELFERFREPLLSLCLNMTGSWADAEDALQETFVAVHRALPAFRGDSKLSTWLYRIAIRTALRLRRRKPVVLEATPEQVVASGDPGEREELSRELEGAMARLSPEHRIVLSLFAIDGLSQEEVALVLGIPVGTVWSRLHTARKRLAGLLGRS